MCSRCDRDQTSHVNCTGNNDAQKQNVVWKSGVELKNPTFCCPDHGANKRELRDFGNKFSFYDDRAYASENRPICCSRCCLQVEWCSDPVCLLCVCVCVCVCRDFFSLCILFFNCSQFRYCDCTLTCLGWMRSVQFFKVWLHGL